MLPVPVRLDEIEAAKALLGSLSYEERNLLSHVCSRIYYPFNENPDPALLPYSVAYGEVGGFVAGWDDPTYARLVEDLHSHLVDEGRSEGWREFGWGYCQRVCMMLCGEPSPGTMDGILLPLRLVASVPTDFIPVVKDALPSLGIEKAIQIPGLVVRELV